MIKLHRYDPQRPTTYYEHVRPVIQIYSRSLIRITGRISGVTFLHADNEDSDQTARLRRLICVFVGRMSECSFSHVAVHT